MSLEDEIRASLGMEPGTPPRFRWVQVDGWMFARGGKWHFFRANGLELLSICKRHAFHKAQDLSTQGYRSEHCCKDCIAGFWKLVEAGEIERPNAGLERQELHNDTVLNGDR